MLHPSLNLITSCISDYIQVITSTLNDNVLYAFKQSKLIIFYQILIFNFLSNSHGPITCNNKFINFCQNFSPNQVAPIHNSGTFQLLLSCLLVCESKWLTKAKKILTHVENRNKCI